MRSDVSIVIPTLDNFSDVKIIISSINAQNLLPSEIILADSSMSNEIEREAQNLESFVPIHFLRVGRAYRFDRFLHRFFSLPLLSFFKDRFR